ncbi:MAG: hypothetical protein ACOC5T_04855 [Elusimicrobiota bacterium]
MRDDYYRIKFENGVISVFIFDKNNPIPHTSYKGKVSSKETIMFLEEAYNRINDQLVKKFIRSVVENKADGIRE